MLSACDLATSTTSTPVTASPSAAAATATATASPSATPTPTVYASPPPGAFLVPQAGVDFTVPAGLGHVADELVPTASWTVPDSNGVNRTPVAVIGLSSDAWLGVRDHPEATCTGLLPKDAPEMIVTVWDVDPLTLRGRGFGPTSPAAAKVRNLYLHVDEIGDEFSMFGCGSGQTSAGQTLWERETPLLRRMVTAATAARPLP